MEDINLFSGLSTDQYSQLKGALGYITVLIAGADGDIDEQELNWAEKLTHIRSYAKPEALNHYYADVEENFSEKLQALIRTLPTEQKERELAVTTHLSGLNSILAILENETAYQIYESFTSFAKHIAKASGGFLRFGSVSAEEKAFISLPMIDPIIREIEDEEE